MNKTRLVIHVGYPKTGSSTLQYGLFKYLHDINHLQLKGVGYSIYYPHPVPRLEYYQKKYRYVSSEYTNASYFSDYSIALPVGPHLQKKDMNNIAITLINIINSLYEK